MLQQLIIIIAISTLLLVPAVSFQFLSNDANIGRRVRVLVCSADQSVECVTRAAAVLTLNQRKLTREMKKIRFDSQKALDVLATAYPHLTISSNEISMPSDENEWTYEQLIDILHQDAHNGDGVLFDAELPVVIDGKSISMAIEVLGKARNISAAILLLKKAVDGVISNRKLHEELFPELNGDGENDNNELCTVYKSIMSMLGRAQPQSSRKRRQSSEVYSHFTLYLLRHHIPKVAQIQPGLQIYHAVFNALGRHGKNEAITVLLNEMKDPPADRMAYQIAISSLAKSGECHAATHLLSLMRERGLSPDIGCYNELLIGIAKKAGRHHYSNMITYDKDKQWHELALEILQDIECQSDLLISDQTYNSVIAACGKEGAWKAAASIARRSNSIFYNSGTDGEIGEQESSYFSNLEVFRKNGKGKDAWWEVLKYSSKDQNRPIIVGIQPHRNPKQNGMSLVFYRNDLEGKQVKVGRVLLKNTQIPQTKKIYQSSIVGMEVSKEMRGEGLSKVLVAIWLHICLGTEVTYPRAAMMNKPLIAMVLDKFGFIADEGGTRCKLVRLEENDANDHDKPRFGLYSSQRQNLDGAFSHRVLRVQNIKLLGSPPDSSLGVDVVIKTTFSHPYRPPDDERNSDEMQREKTLLEDKINSALNLMENKTSAIEYYVSSEKVNKAFLSF